MREIDHLTAEQYATPSLLLMEGAAAATLQVIASRFGENLEGKKARVLCGRGNNGGDGAALARQLARVGVHTDVVLFGRVADTKDDARTNFEAVKRLAGFDAGSISLPPPLSFVECTSVSAWENLARPRRSYDILIDALFGTGLTRPLEGIYLQVIEHVAMMRRARERARGARPLIVSVDIPSGLNADLNEAIGPAIQADITVTFTAPKPANVLPPASNFSGELIVAKIGSPETLVDKAAAKLFVVEVKDARRWLVTTRYVAESYKNSHGHALIVAGSRDYSGAAALCGNAAMRSGAGLVTVAVPVSSQSSVAARAMPEVMTTSLAETDRGSVSDEAIEHVLKLGSKANVIAIGPGLTASDTRTQAFVRAIVERRTTPMVIDADGLNCLSPWPKTLQGSAKAPLILTPHPGEMLRLLGSSDDKLAGDRVTIARDFAVSHNVILVLKGSRSLVAAPDGRVFINPTGNAGLGTAGAGDTLTGLVAGFLAQAYATLKDDADVLESVIAALYIGGLAGDLAAARCGMRTMVASDIRDHFGAAIQLLDGDGEQPDSSSVRTLQTS
jgi:ADP-dependent NAD(P)H-hydrate dehydratase / NAD(P)H-hydrate epimerase